jgi:hypothetical protein
MLALFASTTQKSYYQNTRDRKRDLEKLLGLGDLAIAPTPGMGGVRGRIARVTTFQNFMLAALLAADLAGLGASIADAIPTPPSRQVAIALRVHFERSRRGAASFPLIVTQGKAVVSSLTARPGTLALVRLRSGSYQVFVLGRTTCTRPLVVGSEPVESASITCP